MRWSARCWGGNDVQALKHITTGREKRTLWNSPSLPSPDQFLCPEAEAIPEHDKKSKCYARVRARRAFPSESEIHQSTVSKNSRTARTESIPVCKHLFNIERSVFQASTEDRPSPALQTGSGTQERHRLRKCPNITDLQRRYITSKTQPRCRPNRWDSHQDCESKQSMLPEDLVAR